jgi:thiol-disulfide isomerase/thioredoxin
MLRTLMVLGSVSGVLLLAGCAGGSGGDLAREPSVSASTEASARPATAAGESAGAEADGASADGKDGQAADSVPENLDFSGTTVSGDEFQGASLAGRPTLLWLWAPWCPTCRGQFPQVEGLATEHEGDLNVVGVGSLDSAEAIAGFADDVEGITHLEDSEGELWKRFGVTEQSSFVLLDAAGTVVFEAGYGGSEDLDARVEDLLG